jgi:steroid delta-isomerase-like uncharacterized protein
MKNPTESNKSVAIRWFEEVWNLGRTGIILDLAHPHAVAHDMEGPGVDTTLLDAFLAFHRSMRGAIPDLHIAILDAIAENDRVALRVHSTGTHSGPDLGVPPTHNRIDFASVVIFRFEDGKIAEAWNFLDQLALYQQLRILNVG